MAALLILNYMAIQKRENSSCKMKNELSEIPVVEFTDLDSKFHIHREIRA